VPFALVGGVFLQWRWCYHDTAVIIGYIACSAVRDSDRIIMIICHPPGAGAKRPDETYMGRGARRIGAAARPKLMTVSGYGVVADPIMISTGPGMES
jgi:Cu/Ag efflux pump CusA